MRRIISVSVLLSGLWTLAGPGALGQTTREDLTVANPSQAPLTFFAVHCEPQAANPAMWEALTRFIAMADRYNAKLTLMFNPQWAEFVCGGEARFACLKAWQKAGHEVAVHYHNVVHGGWNGYTNRKDDRYTQDPRYRGTVPEMMKLLEKLAVPDRMLTMCMGPDARWDSLTEVEIDEPDYPDGLLYDVDGMDVGLTPLMKTKFKGRDLFHLKHHFFAPGTRAKHFERIKEEFRRAKPNEVLGVVTHETDFARSPEFFEQWFRFCHQNKASIKTVRDIVRDYPPEKIVEVRWARQERDPGHAGQDVIHIVLRHLLALPEVDKDNVGIVTFSFGIVGVMPLDAMQRQSAGYPLRRKAPGKRESQVVPGKASSSRNGKKRPPIRDGDDPDGFLEGQRSPMRRPGKSRVGN
jgi:sugar phosphate isomerase/epimerase